MQKTVLAFGETLWDLLPNGAKLGGAPFNFAYRVHSLGDRGLIVSRLGKDDLGDEAWDRVVSLGMDRRFLQRDPNWPTGTVEISLDADNNPDYFIVPDVAYDHIEVSDALLETASEADCICYGTLAQRNAQSRKTLRQTLDAASDATKLLDINLRKNCHTKESIHESLDRADILRLNEDEAAYLAEEFGLSDSSVPGFSRGIIERWALSHCLVTLGPRGAFVASAEGETVYAPGYVVDLVDTCGSGDAFTAGFIHKLLRGAPLRECCELGNVLGALVATQSGATDTITSDDIQRFREGNPQRSVDSRFEDYLAE